MRGFAAICLVTLIPALAGEDCSAVKLLPEPGSDGAALGVAVAATPDWLIAGAPGVDFGRGTAYAYRRDGEAWLLHTELDFPTSVTSSYGSAIAISDSTVAIGAPSEFSYVDENGLVVLFRFDGVQWQFDGVLSGVEDSGLGYSVALNHDLLVVGAPLTDDARGAVHVYRRGAAGWVEEAVLPQPSRPHSEQYFGTAVAVHGDWIAVGEGAEIETPGRAFLYHYENGEWTLHTTLDYPSSCISCNYGRMVSLTDGWFAVSGDQSYSPIELYQLQGNEWVLKSSFGFQGFFWSNYFYEVSRLGAASLYRREADGWNFWESVAPPAGQPAVNWAYRSAVAGSWYMYGLTTDDESGNDAGAVWVSTLPIDCNNNGVSDACDIATGSSSDANADGVPDDCQPNACPRSGCENLDIAGNDCVINLGDLGLLLANFNREGWDIAGDSDIDGDVDLADLGAMLAAWGADCNWQVAEEEAR